MSNSIKSFLTRIPILLVLTFTFSLSPAADDVDLIKSRVENLERELASMRSLLEQQAQQSVTREEVQELKEEVRVTRANQAEWKTYDSKVHLAGYAAVGYTNKGEMNNDAFQQVQFNPIFHYSYKDLFLLEAELEMEIEEGETHIGLEYMTVDWFINDYIALVAGKFMSPLGQFQQNLHPAWINKLPSMPVGFGHGGAQPSAEVGAQLRGGFELPLFGDRSLLNYSVYVGNGPQLELEDHGAGHGEEVEEEAGHDEEEEEEGHVEEVEQREIEGIATEGFTADIDDEKVFGGRIGFLPIPNLEIGFSGAFGKVGLENEATRDYNVLSFDLFYRLKNLDLRAEYVKQKVGDLASSIAPEGQWWEAWYTQASYKLLPTKFELVARYGELNSTHASQEQKQWAIGINYLIANQGMVKLAYQFNDGVTGSRSDEDRFLLQLTYGF